MRLGDAGRNGANAEFRYQLHADARIAIGVLQVVNELSQVFDRVDIMMRRR